MEQNSPGSRLEIGPVKKALARLAGADPDMLSNCTPGDLDSVMWIAYMMLGVYVYQTGLLSIVAHRMIAEPGTIRPELIAAAALIATIILLVDSFMIMRSSWHAHGIQELKRGGLDISGGFGFYVKNAVFLTFRLALSAVLAQIMAVFIALILFHHDTSAILYKFYQATNAPLVELVAGRVDFDINKAQAASDASSRQIEALDSEAAEERKTSLTIEQADPTIPGLRTRVATLQDDQRAAQARLRDAEDFSADELAGNTTSKKNSGKPGDGPVRRAAEERVAAARTAVEAGERSITEAKEELARAEQRAEDAVKAQQLQVKAKLETLEGKRVAERARNRELAETYRSMVDRRDELIRQQVDLDPTHVPLDDSFLAHLKALHTLTQDREILIVVILIDIAMFGIEIAAVLAKILSFVPTTYATMVASEAYLHSVRRARHVAYQTELLAPAFQPQPDFPTTDPQPLLSPDEQSDEDEQTSSSRRDISDRVKDIFENAARRRRGRPPKSNPGLSPDT